MAKAKRKKPFRAADEVKAIARERVGPIPPPKVIVSKIEKPPKHRADPLQEPE
jgi:hypothetical protein